MGAMVKGEAMFSNKRTFFYFQNRRRRGAETEVGIEGAGGKKSLANGGRAKTIKSRQRQAAQIKPAVKGRHEESV